MPGLDPDTLPMQKFTFNICLVEYTDHITEFLPRILPLDLHPVVTIFIHLTVFQALIHWAACPNCQGLESLSETICC